jgi:hypothetical protein
MVVSMISIGFAPILRLLRVVLFVLREADQRVEVAAMGRRDLGVEHGVE